MNSKESSILCDSISSNTVQINHFVTLHKRLCKAPHRFQKCKKEPGEALVKKLLTISISRCKNNKENQNSQLFYHLKMFKGYLQ